MKTDQPRTVRIGTRASELALWQTNWVAGKLRERFPAVQIEIVTIKTIGDKILDAPLSTIGDKGLFIKEIEVALLENRVDLAVHSLKDVPTLVPEGLALGAITRREDVRDVFIAHPDKKHKSFDDLPPGASVATGSLRRKCQLLRLRPDIRIMDIRGNLNTRFRKLGESDWDGMILAKAGVTRLGWSEKITEVFPADRVLPAVGQGALALEIRAADKQTKKIIGALNHDATEQSTRGERALLRRLEGGCQIPIGTYGRIEKDEFFLDAIVGTIDGKKTVRGKIHGASEDAEALGQRLAETLLAGGADEILQTIRLGSIPVIPVV